MSELVALLQILKMSSLKTKSVNPIQNKILLSQTEQKHFNPQQWNFNGLWK